jgi:hypothetical protein
MGGIPECIDAINMLESMTAVSWLVVRKEHVTLIMAQVNDCPQLSEVVHDVKRFVLLSSLAIEQAPLQAYYGALILSGGERGEKDV